MLWGLCCQISTCVMTRLGRLAGCPRYYQYYEYAIYYYRYCQLYQTLKTIQLSLVLSHQKSDNETELQCCPSFLSSWVFRELPRDKCFIFQVAASLGSLGNPHHLVYDLYLFTSDLWYRNDKSKNFQNQILNWLLG